jgi:hypothetical protein
MVTIGLGRSQVSGRNLVPAPPAINTARMAILGGYVPLILAQTGRLPPALQRFVLPTQFYILDVWSFDSGESFGNNADVVLVYIH